MSNAWMVRIQLLWPRSGYPSKACSDLERGDVVAGEDRPGGGATMDILLSY